MGQIVGIAIVWFIIEMLLWYLVAQFISGWWVFGWFIVAAIIGIALMRRGMAVLNPMAQQMKSGGMNPAMGGAKDGMVKTIAMAAAGILLLIPGLLSDLLALLAILPPVQKKLKNAANNYVMNNQQKMMEMMSKQMGGQMGGTSPFGGMGGAQNPFGGVGGGAQNPFGTNSRFGQKQGSANDPFGSVYKGNTTVEGTAKSVTKDVKRITKPANDEQYVYNADYGYS